MIVKSQLLTKNSDRLSIHWLYLFYLFVERHTQIVMTTVLNLALLMINSNKVFSFSTLLGIIACLWTVFEWEKRRTGTLCLRTPKEWGKDAEDRAPKARGVLVQGLGIAVSSPSGSGQSPAAKRHLVHFWPSLAKTYAWWISFTMSRVVLKWLERRSGAFRSHSNTVYELGAYVTEMIFNGPSVRIPVHKLIIAHMTVTFFIERCIVCDICCISFSDDTPVNQG